MLIVFDAKYLTAGIVILVPYRITDELKAIRSNGLANILCIDDDAVTDSLIALRHIGAWFQVEFDSGRQMRFCPIPDFEIIPGPLGSVA